MQEEMNDIQGAKKEMDGKREKKKKIGDKTEKDIGVNQKRRAKNIGTKRGIINGRRKERE